MLDEREILVRDTMKRFAQKTGLAAGSAAPERYLWTDAFAVCNFLSLYRATDDRHYLEMATGLVDQVHEVLGRHRPDGQLQRWLSSFSEEEGGAHPTAGGLRIGKFLPDRKPYEPADPQQEWDRDGQYFHYLTKWMHALRQVAVVTGDDKYLRWACELALKAYRSFAMNDLDGKLAGFYWKMSIDLTYPVVASMGHHDPLDGFITFLELDAASQQFQVPLPECGLHEEIGALEELCKGKDWRTDDPLGIGGLLFDACRLHQLEQNEQTSSGAVLPKDLLEAAHQGIGHFVSSGVLQSPASQRLAFRELGLSIGLHAVEQMQELETAAKLEQFAAVGRYIEDFWLQPQHRQTRSWLGHENINMVMLATSLMPDRLLAL